MSFCAFLWLNLLSKRLPKLIAIDLDGTLLRNDKSLSERNIAAIQRASASGVAVVIASARPPRMTRGFHETLGLRTPVVCYNGAMVLDGETYEVVEHTPVPAALMQEVITFTRGLDEAICVSLEIADRWYTDRVDRSLPVEAHKLSEPDVLGPLTDYADLAVTKCMFLAPPERLRVVQEALAKQFAGRVAIHVSDAHLIQIVHPSVDKGHAVAAVAERLGIAAADCVAIGDAPNDIGMLQWAGCGVAIGNAWDDVKAVADEVTATNEADGVAVLIEGLLGLD